MADLNCFSFSGRLTKDAIVKEINGKYLMEMTVANNIGFGNYAKVNWIKVKEWGPKVNNIVNIFTKGSLVFGYGELTTEEWTSSDGVKHCDLVVTVLNIQLSSKKSAENTDTVPSNDESDNLQF